MNIGILALQGSFARHKEMIESLGEKATLIRYPDEIQDTDGLIIPGGESTTMSRVIERNAFYGILDKYHAPIFGTCAGAILLSEETGDSRVKNLGKIPVKIIRNAFGRQVESFVDFVNLSFSGKPFEGVFIRAPRFGQFNTGVEPLGYLGEEPVMIRYERYLAATFHPELTGDSRIHAYFLDMCRSYK